jgi:ribosomal protein L34E
MPARERPYEKKNCPRCGKEFVCSASARCWCFEYSLSVEAMDVIQNSYQGCVCPECLSQFASTEIQEIKH